MVKGNVQNQNIHLPMIISQIPYGSVDFEIKFEWKTEPEIDHQPDGHLHKRRMTQTNIQLGTPSWLVGWLVVHDLLNAKHWCRKQSKNAVKFL